MKKCLFMLTIFFTFSYSVFSGVNNNQVVSKAYIRFYEYDGTSSPGGGIFIGIHPNLKGWLYLENTRKEVIEEVPVLVNFFEAGLILGLNYVNINSKMTLKNVTGKNVNQILGVYRGFSLGTSVSIGFNSSFAYNKNLVFLSDFEGRLYGAGINMNALKVTITRR